MYLFDKSTKQKWLPLKKKKRWTHWEFYFCLGYRRPPENVTLLLKTEKAIEL